MSLLHVTVKPLTTKDQDNHVYISTALQQHLQCKDNLFITVGNVRKSVSIILFQSQDYVMMCPDSLLKEWRLPQREYSLRALSSDELILGPVICIVTEIRNSEELFGTITAFCEEFVNACKSHHCFCYVSSLQDLITQPLKGYVYDNNKWLYTDVPAPNMVHNRIHARKTEQTLSFQTLKERLEKQHIPFFNAHYLNKWTVFERLSQATHLQSYLPQTYQLRSKQNLIDSLQQHETIFLKPVHGSQGKHIFRVTGSKNQYHLDYTTFTGEYKKEYDSPQEIFETLYGQLAKQGFIIQEGISLQTYKDCPFDFRILCHKKDQLAWKVTSIVTRVSKQGNFVSNVARGGEVYPPKQILSYLYDETNAKHIISFLKEIAIEICLHLPRIDELYAEFGVDLAIDQEGKPWIIEVNTKPSKQTDFSPNTIRPSTKALIDYCLTMTNFS
ncbi:YheC/YheD family protein [Priestia megaterium]|nr:YheC/YheD family protein [Priestia megaterium]